MKRKLNENASPPAKKRKIDDDDEKEEKEKELDPSIIIPKLKVRNVQNGIIEMEILNIESFIDQEDVTNEFYEFDLMHKRGDNEWQSLHSEVADELFFEIFYIKSTEEIKEYTLQLKIRSKLQSKSEDQWSPFCDTMSIQIKSSLLAHQYSVGQNVDFREEKEFYSRSGRIIQVFPDNKVRVRPWPKCLSEKQNDSDDDAEFANLLHFLDVYGHVNNVNANGMVDVDIAGALANYFKDDGQKSKDVELHCSRLYGFDGIRLMQVVDISDNQQQEMDKNILLAIDGNANAVMEMFDALKCSFFGYAKKCDDVYPDYQFKYMARFVSKNVCDFIMESDVGCRWKIGCLRESTDGNMKLNAVRSDIINARILGLKANIDGIASYDIDSVVSFCDICRLEMSEFDWRYNCKLDVTNRHDVCMQCAYNVVKQHIQLKDLLFPLLEKELNNDCIQEIAAFVVGSVVQL